MAKSSMIHAGNYRNRPGWFKFLNAAWEKLYPLGLRTKLDRDLLIKSARGNTGLKDLGKDFWEEPLDRLLDSINNEAQLHPVGRFITRKRLENLLSVRLRAEDWFKKHPEILDQSLYPVMVIIGLQRTGTTKLHRMLASDPDTRALLSWEAINPAPMNGDLRSGKERIKMARMSEKALRIMSPGFFAIHPVEHLAPEEDVLLLDISFMSTTPEATMHVPSYANWLESIDQSPAYAYAVKMMKFLQWQRPAKRWVLKTPHHLEFLDLAEKYFTDSRFIWTHRNVYEAIPSFLSMVSYSRILFSNRVDAQGVARHWVRKIGYMLTKALDHRKKNSHNRRFLDVPYQEIVGNSRSVMKKIYDHAGLDIGPALWNKFEDVEILNPIGKYGTHVYRLEDFGTNKEIIDEFTSEYQAFQKQLQVLRY